MGRAPKICSFVIATALAVPLLAQDLGVAINLPIPELTERQMKEYHVIELAGAMPAEGDLLVDGKLPLPVIDFVSRLGMIHQRLSLFENGLVALELSGAGGTIRKRVIIPPDAVTAYRNYFVAADLAAFEPYAPGNPGHDQVILRISAADGTHVERRFPATAMLPALVERQRHVLQELLRALAEDREVTNPIAGYKGKIGDVLLGDDQKSYRVLRLVAGGEFLELLCTTEPVRRFVSRKDLHLYFIGVRPGS
ncbi:MAG TPA: hypothetical protein VM557_08330 [Thermoanaerobaculia bacterium]|nr:hypothetical protein [Thermoanaerobaculia bacterium]